MVTVRAGYSKHRRQDVQSLPDETAVMLAGYLAEADEARPFNLSERSGAMLHADMAEARAAAGRDDAGFLMPRDSRGLVLDFHSFRHGYVTAICRANVSPRVMMELARHSDPKLTMKRYGRVSISDSAAALDALPRLTPRGDDRQEQRATGTDNATALQDAVGCPRTGDHGLGRSRPYRAGGHDGHARERAGDSQNHRAIPFAKPCIREAPARDSHGRDGRTAESVKPLETCGNAAVFAENQQTARGAQLDGNLDYFSEVTGMCRSAW